MIEYDGSPSPDLTNNVSQDLVTLRTLHERQCVWRGIFQTHKLAFYGYIIVRTEMIHHSKNMGESEKNCNATT